MTKKLCNRASDVPEKLFYKIMSDFSEDESVKGQWENVNVALFPDCHAIVALQKAKCHVDFVTTLKVWCYDFPDGFNLHDFNYDFNLPPVLEINGGLLITNNQDPEAPEKGNLIVEDVMIQCRMECWVQSPFVAFIAHIMVAVEAVRSELNPVMYTYYERWLNKKVNYLD